MENISCVRPFADFSQIERCKATIDTLNSSFFRVANGLEMAGNPVRLKILFLLSEEKGLCVCDLSDIMGITVSAVSQHLRKMKDRNLIHSSKEGQTIYYSLSSEYADVLRPFFQIITESEALEAV
ncbi:ArsR/SmtB family transcription factor [Rufibacter sediminis]|uniref:Winged helix-turn-helix transcriptional regulator n=1 Tax=Rufibacter sediminis TaxID=2762756 RepID=A0ABR6VM35_9BACT|nr:metalloregulator ArsR/SmtB family transcription factor [Rufibacter sediminis]MBC3538257.1 winged helix-turn-helix transcriptional regulator [Rufibacter sediminis]